MEGICNLLRPVIESDHKDETLRNLLLSCVDQRAFAKCSGGLSSFIGVVNGMLNEPSSRYDGLIILQSFLPQCSVGVLTQYASSWIQFCLKGAAASRTAQLSFIVFKMLLNLSESVPELSRHVSSIVVSNFAELIHQGISSHAYINALECLELCMKKFSGPCGPHRKVIDSFLLSLLDYTGSNQGQVLWGAARCMAMLPQIGGGGVDGVQHKLAWSTQQKQLARTIHLILDDLYADTNELQVSLMGNMLEATDPLRLPEIDESNPILRTQKLVTRLISVTGCLQAMLVLAYPVPKNVSMSAVMNLICRGLAVNGSSIGAGSTTHLLALSADLPKVHQALLKLLEALILLCRNNLLPFASSICRLCVQTLKWTRVDEWSYGSERPYKHLKIEAFRILKLWCGTAKSGSGVEDVAQQFIDVSLNDIFSEKDSVSLTAGLRKKNQRRSKGNKGAASPGGAMLKDGEKVNEFANREVCVAALEAVSTMVMAGSSRIQASVYKTLQETVVAILLKASVNAGESLIPYKDPSARLELYRLLLQLVLYPHTVWPAPTNIALKLFSNGLNDPGLQISMFCGTAQSVLEKIIHPAYPSLYVTPSHKEIDACIETAAQQTAATPGLLNRNLASTTFGGSDHDLTDAVSLTPSLKASSTRLNTAYSSPVLAGGHSTQVGSKMSASVLTHVLKNSTEQSTQHDTSDVEDQKLSELKEKVAADSSEKDSSLQKAIDLTNSDISDDEIAEVPCEINLADSEDEKADSDGDKSNVSLCSQSTVNTPVVVKSDKSPKASNEARSPSKPSPGLKEVSGESASNGVPEPTETSTDVVSNETEENAVKETALTNGTSEANDEGVSAESAKRVLEDETGSASKKAKLEDDDKRAKMDDEEMEFPSDEDSMLLSFVDVTRDEENEGDE